MNTNELYQNLLAAWKELDDARRFRLIAIGAVIGVVTVVLSFWVLRPNYQVLFADLETRDAAAIVAELKRLKVPYKLTDGGAKILVEEKRVYETRLSLMGKGVPLAGGVGFEIFDNKDIGMTEYTQRINYQRALQGELARTIMAIEHVKTARVHLVVSESSIFRRQNIKPKASVSLVLKPGARLSSDQILGIQRLVAASVSGLDANGVIISDQGGVTLSAASDGDENYAQVSGKLKLKRNAEDYFVRKISDVLDRTFGPGQAIVSVDVDLNFDEVKRTAQTVIPVRSDTADGAGAVVRKRQSIHRQPKGAIKAVDGETAYAGGSSDITSTTDVEYELGKSIEQVASSPGGIRRISVGVIVPKMTAEQIGRVQSVVAMTVGLSTARGDAITVQPLNEMMTEPESTSKITDVPAARSDDTNVVSAVRRALKDPLMITMMLGALLAFTVVIVAFLLRRRPMAASELSAVNAREARLAEIRSLLDAERSKGTA